MQNQGGTEFANLHREFKKASDSSRDSAQKMAQMQVTAKKMESEYRALLEAAVRREPNTGTPWVPNMTDIITEQFNVLKTELIEEKDENQRLVDAANAAVATCNEVMVNRTRDSVDPLAAANSAARTKHKTCRALETTQVPDRDVQCVPPTYQGTPVCEADQDWYNNGAVEAWSGDSFSASTDLNAAIVQAGKCVDYREHGKQCDRDQVNFETAFCLYSQELRETCSVHHSCYNQAIADRSVTVENVGELESAQKMVWKALQKIFCYMDKLKNAGLTGQNPTSQDITDCTALEPATDPLDIEKPAPEAETFCDQGPVQFQPGNSQWDTNEYGAAPFSDANLHQVTFPLGDWQRGMEAITAC